MARKAFMQFFHLLATSVTVILSGHLLTSCGGKVSPSSSGGTLGPSGTSSEIEVSGSISDEASVDFVQSSASLRIGRVNLTDAKSYVVKAYSLEPRGSKKEIFTGSYAEPKFNFKSTVARQYMIIEITRLPDGGQFGSVLPPPAGNKQASLVVDGTTTIAAKMATLIASKAESGDQGAQQALSSGSVSVADLLMVAQSVRTTVVEQKEQNKESAIDLSSLTANLISKSNDLIAKLTAEGQSSAGIAEKLSEASYKTIFGDDAKAASAGILAYRVNPDLGSSEAAKTTVAYEAIKASSSDSMKPVDEAFRVESAAYRTSTSVAAAAALKTKVSSDFKTVFSSCMSSPSSCAQTSYTPPQPQPSGVNVPGAPTSVTGTAIDTHSGHAGDTQVSLNWTAPASSGGSSIIDYVIQYSSDSGSNWTTFSDGISTSTNMTVTGLKNSQTYVFRVAATNSDGTGSYSSYSSGVKRPGWSEVTTGGSNVTMRDNVSSLWWSNDRGTMTWFDAQRQCANLDYNGQSEWRLPSRDELAAALLNQISLRGAFWSGSLAPGYDIRGFSSDLLAWTVMLSPSAGEPAVTLQKYDYAKVVCVRPSVTTPEAPASVTGTAGNMQVLLAWTAPLSNGGSSITDYVIQYSSDGGSDWTTFSDGISTSTNATVTGLMNGRTYIFRVGAINSAGTVNYSSDSSSVTPFTPPGAPTSVTGNSRYVMSKGSVDDGLELTWTAPSNDGGSAITGYVVQYKAASAGKDEAWSTLSDGNLRWASPRWNGGLDYITSYANSPQAWVMGLTPGIYYIFKVAAKNSAGTGSYSVSSLSVKPAGWSEVTVGDSYTARTMRDNITGLWWSYIHGSTYWINIKKSQGPTWSDAKNFCDSLSFNGQSDWRLPSKEELLTAKDHDAAIQLPRFYNQEIPNFFWSGSKSPDKNDYVWAVTWDRWFGQSFGASALNYIGNYVDVQTNRDSFSVVCVRP